MNVCITTHRVFVKWREISVFPISRLFRPAILHSLHHRSIWFIINYIIRDSLLGSAPLHGTLSVRHWDSSGHREGGMDWVPVPPMRLHTLRPHAPWESSGTTRGRTMQSQWNRISAEIGLGDPTLSSNH